MKDFKKVISFAKPYRGQIILAMVMLAETDCPYLTPEPFRGKRNLPHYLIYTLGKIAEIKKEPVEKIEGLLEENSRKLFKISSSKVEGAGKNSKIK